MIHATQYDPDITVIKPGVERLTAVNATAFKEEVVALINKGANQLVIDFAAVTFLDSSGLGALVGVLKKIGHRGELLVSGLNGDVAQVFRVCRMDRVFQICPDTESAKQLLRERQ